MLAKSFSQHGSISRDIAGVGPWHSYVQRVSNVKSWIKLAMLISILELPLIFLAG